MRPERYDAARVPKGSEEATVWTTSLSISYHGSHQPCGHAHIETIPVDSHKLFSLMKRQLLLANILMPSLIVKGIICLLKVGMGFAENTHLEYESVIF